MSSRIDQLRDSDAIQRDCITAKLVRGVLVTFSFSTKKDKKVVSMEFVEPNNSANAPNPKFSFRVEDENYEAAFNQWGQILDDATAAFKDARDSLHKKNK